MYGCLDNEEIAENKLGIVLPSLFFFVQSIFSLQAFF